MPRLSPTGWAYFDLLLVASATIVTYRLLLHENPQYRWVAGPGISGAAFCGGIMLAGLIFGLYERHTLAARSRILVRSAATLGVGLTLAYAFLSLFFYAETTRWLGLGVAVIYAGLAVPLRLAAHGAVAHERINVLCIGAGESIRNIIPLLTAGRRPHYDLVGFVDVRPWDGEPEPFLDPQCPRLGDLSEIDRVLRKSEVDEVVVDADCTADAAVGTAVLTCLDHNCRVTDQPTFLEKFRGEVPAECITPQWFLMADVRQTGSFEALKRIMDIAAALLGLALALPLWPLIALAIKLDSRGPVIYRQRRVGLHGRPFRICKFRTMRVDAERNGAQWASRNDRRVTRVGRLLRRSRLDELPQLWNILRGEMSLVGPRPERPEFVEQLATVVPHYRQRHLIKPGLTGWAQIHYGYGASVDDARHKLHYDLYYLKHRCIDLDAAIIIRTCGRFLLGAR